MPVAGNEVGIFGASLSPSVSPVHTFGRIEIYILHSLRSLNADAVNFDFHFPEFFGKTLGLRRYVFRVCASNGFSARIDGINFRLRSPHQTVIDFRNIFFGIRPTERQALAVVYAVDSRKIQGIFDRDLDVAVVNGDGVISELYPKAFSRRTCVADDKIVVFQADVFIAVR